MQSANTRYQQQPQQQQSLESDGLSDMNVFHLWGFNLNAGNATVRYLDI